MKQPLSYRARVWSQKTWMMADYAPLPQTKLELQEMLEMGWHNGYRAAKEDARRDVRKTRQNRPTKANDHD